MSDELRQLQALARAYGVLPTFIDVSDQRRTASVGALRAALAALGCEVDGETDLAAAREDRRRAVLSRVVEPVVVLQGESDRVEIPVRLPESATGTMRVTVTPEEDRVRTTSVEVDSLPIVARRHVGSDAYLRRTLALKDPLPLGYHRLRIAFGGESYESLLIRAPRTLWAPPESRGTQWGVFLPTYAAHGEKSWGSGDFTDLRQLLDWTGESGGSFVGTLPLLATEWEFGIDPSPYAPTSRRFWNEFYLDPRRCAEFEECEAAKKLVLSADFLDDLSAARQATHVDYERVVRMKRQVVELLAEHFFNSGEERRRELDEWLLDHPEVGSFARFRATGEANECRWPQWESHSLDSVETLDVDMPSYRYHLYAQWQTQLQLAELDRGPARLYLDLPLGVRRDGYDVWCDPEAFALAASGGAPPDSFFTKGQNWGFPPLHPEGIREVGYRPWIEGVRAHLAFAKLLRVDHAMGLHRLYWIPAGADSKDGVYVRYRTEEMFAILALESHRHEAILVGENLGTCPPAVDEAMDRAAMSGMYVLEFEVNAESEEQTLNPVPAVALASLNTHDLPTFSAFWNALDVDDHLDLGLVDEDEAKASRTARAEMRMAVTAFLVREKALAEPTDDERAIFLACTHWLVEQQPRYVIANLEDAWGEPKPQNSPGTWLERPNWQRKSQLSLEEIASDDRVRAMVETITAAARGGSV